MAKFDIIEAERILDEDLTDEQIDFLVASRQGAALHDVDDKTFRNLSDRGFVQIVPFDHPRATNAILGVIPTDDGIKILNVLDDRKWSQADEPIYADVEKTEVETEAQVHAQSTGKDKATRKGEIKASSSQNKDYENKK